MLKNLLFGIPIMGVCLMLQALLVVAAIRYYAFRQSLLSKGTFWVSLRITGGVMLLLICASMAQIALWAFFFRLLGEFDCFHTAFYHSAVNFSTLGYGDMVMSEARRLLGPMEAINGVLMIGVSTAVLMAVFTDIIKKTGLIQKMKNQAE